MIRMEKVFDKLDFNFIVRANVDEVVGNAMKEYTDKSIYDSPDARFNRTNVLIYIDGVMDLANQLMNVGGDLDG